jgi:hypothetical protein
MNFRSDIAADSAIAIIGVTEQDNALLRKSPRPLGCP